MEGWDGGYPSPSQNVTSGNDSSPSASSPASSPRRVLAIPEAPEILSTRSYHQQKTDEEIRNLWELRNSQSHSKGWWARFKKAVGVNSLNAQQIEDIRKAESFAIRMYVNRQEDGSYKLFTESVHDRPTHTETFVLEHESGLTLLDAIHHLRQFEQHDDFKDPLNGHPYHHIKTDTPVAEAPKGTWWKDYITQHNITLTEHAKPVSRNKDGFITEQGVYVVPKA